MSLGFWDECVAPARIQAGIPDPGSKRPTIRRGAEGRALGQFCRPSSRPGK